MLLLVTLLCFFTFTTIVLTILYFRQSEVTKLECMALQNLLTDDEKKFYITEYKKIVACKLIFERMSEPKAAIDIAREVVKSGREK